MENTATGLGGSQVALQGIHNNNMLRREAPCSREREIKNGDTSLILLGLSANDALLLVEEAKALMLSEISGESLG